MTAGSHAFASSRSPDGVQDRVKIRRDGSPFPHVAKMAAKGQFSMWLNLPPPLDHRNHHPTEELHFTRHFGRPLVILHMYTLCFIDFAKLSAAISSTGMLSSPAGITVRAWCVPSPPLTALRVK
jgi:hypothetical protein